MRNKHCLSQKELARRWGISHRTLERWRYLGQGPAFLKLGGRILYRHADIEDFEQSQLQRASSGRESVRGSVTAATSFSKPARATERLAHADGFGNAYRS